MDNLFDELMERIFVESYFSLGKIEYSEEEYNWSTSLYIAHKPQGDYFIYLTIPSNLLSYVNNDIQIKLVSLIKNDTEQFEQINGDEVKISSSFDKNATLIIFTSHEGDIDQDVLKQSILIEEDPYFFKKQVLSISNQELSIISSFFSDHKEQYNHYLQSLISDTLRFKEFANSLERSERVIEYSFVAKLYEKLPFLSLIVKESDKKNLQQKIDSSLSEEQRLICDELMILDTDDLGNWFETIIKEEVDD